jgi:IclR family transcriptional regulator, KDG regulon repressor
MRQIVDKISAILSLFSFEKSDWGVTEISKALDMPKSTVSELLSSLVQQGLLERSPKARFSLGWRLFGLNQILVESMPMVKEARKAMAELVDRTGEMCHLVVLDRSDVVIVERAQANVSTQNLLAKQGPRSPALTSAAGKILLAALPSEQVKAMYQGGQLNRVGGANIESLEKFQADLDAVRGRGIAFEREGVVAGLTTVAAPIRSYTGEVVGAVTLTATSVRFSTAEMQFISMISEAGRKISSGIGFDIKSMP